MDLSPVFSSKNIDKIARYKWTVVDKPGRLLMVDKNRLNIETEYQRQAFQSKVYEFSNSWSWLACGVIVVGSRDGEYWVIDGQHRVLAAKRRSDIISLPCIVFQTESVAQEAVGFLAANSRRKPVSALAKHKAMVVANDPIALHIESVVKKLGVVLTESGNMHRGMRCISWCFRKATEDRNAFDLVMEVGTTLCFDKNIQVQEKLLDGLWYIHKFCGDGLHDKKLVKRMYEKGATVLIDSITRAQAFFVRGGSRIFAEGILTQINKGLQHKYVLRIDGGSNEE